MNKQDHIAHWLKGAAYNWQEVDTVFTAGAYVPCFFWAHLAIEKLAKALWIQDNEGNTPPFTHNISKLLASTSFVPTPVQAKFILELNAFQLEGRYENYVTDLRELLTPELAREILHNVKELRRCLLNQLL